MKKFSSIINYLSLYFIFFLNSALSTIVADIDIVDFQFPFQAKGKQINTANLDISNQIKPQKALFNQYIRIAFFDQGKQEFLNQFIHYIPIRFQHPYSINLNYPDWFNITYSSPPQENFILDLSIFMANTSILERSKIIRCNSIFNILHEPSGTALNLNELKILDETKPSTRIWCRQDLVNIFPQLLNSQSLNIFFNKFLKIQTSGENLKGSFHLIESQVYKVQNFSFETKEKGRIGELAADMTMQCFGFNKKNGKYGGDRDNGFDGVYNRDDALFISDSKFFATTPSLHNVLHKDIYATIKTRLTNIMLQGSDQAKQTAVYIKNFMISNPDNVFLLPYIVLSNGKVKTLARPFRTVHADLDPTGRTEMLEILFRNLVIGPQTTADLQAVVNQPSIPTTLQMTPADAYNCIHLMMQKFGLDMEYSLIKNQDTWQPITLESLRNPQIKLSTEDLKYFDNLMVQLPTRWKKDEAEKLMGEINDDVHQMQVLKHLRIILGEKNEKMGKLNIGDYLPWLIRNLSISLKPTYYIKTEKLANKIFDIAYKPFGNTSFFDLDLEGYMTIFEVFLSSSHLDEEQNWDKLHLLYYLTYGSLRCTLDIEPEEIRSYLADFVEILKPYPKDQLVNIVNLINELYESKCYLELVGTHNCEDWLLLTQALQHLSSDNQSMIVEFMKEFPSSFSFGPADAVEFLKSFIPLIKELEDLELFDSTDALIKEAFKLYRDPDDQKDCLEIIMQNVRNGKSEEDIRKIIKKKTFQ